MSELGCNLRKSPGPDEAGNPPGVGRPSPGGEGGALGSAEWAPGSRPRPVPLPRPGWGGVWGPKAPNLFRVGLGVWRPTNPAWNRSRVAKPMSSSGDQGQIFLLCHSPLLPATEVPPLPFLFIRGCVPKCRRQWLAHSRCSGRKYCPSKLKACGSPVSWLPGGGFPNPTAGCRTATAHPQTWGCRADGV